MNTSFIGSRLYRVSVVVFGLLLMAVGVVVGRVLPSTSAGSRLPACAEEDSVNCVWDGSTRGNGAGSPFVNVGGSLYYCGN